MTRPSSAGPPRPKRKGAPSVSTLTPSQLARKRANDREAQRVIRARTKEHIERLERELEERKSMQSRNQTVQELLRRNKALEEELMRLKESREVPMTSSPYCVPVCDGNPSTGSDAIPSPRGSSFSDDCNSLPDYSQQYVPQPNNCESWASTVPCPVPSKASSPSPSADNYSTGYIPTSVPTSILPSNNTSSLSISPVGHKDIAKMDLRAASMNFWLRSFKTVVETPRPRRCATFWGLHLFRDVRGKDHNHRERYTTTSIRQQPAAYEIGRLNIALLCLWHVNKAVLQHCRPFFASKVGQAIEQAEGKAWDEFYAFLALDCGFPRRKVIRRAAG
ncbi:hypothetical protein MRS44_017102 [Fusarium solani]|uniref:uncharacterized protein n=1 Tax=Fusarium solani TaxID=169388 RepID=UPI0032C4A4DC|nr:hypothetical protein MRS44_017102 [Fusarium solani]